jgi:hypothetical protein
VAPELSGCPVTVPGPVGKQDPLWHPGSAPVGDRFFVKFAWSRPAALRLAREIGVLTALAREPKVPGQQQILQREPLPGIDAAAAGSCCSSAKTCPGAPSDWAITSSTCSHGAGSARSWSRVSSAMNSSGSRSRRVDSNWPSLVKVTPPSSRACRSDTASAARPRAACSPRRRPRR